MMNIKHMFLTGITLFVVGAIVQTACAQGGNNDLMQRVVRDAELDKKMGAFSDPVILRARLQRAPGWRGIQGAPGYNQAPFYSRYRFDGVAMFPFAPYPLPGGSPAQPPK